MTHVVCEGKALTTPRGIKGPGESVSADDFGGKTRLNLLVKKGYLEPKAKTEKATAATEKAEKAAQDKAKEKQRAAVAKSVEAAGEPPPLPEGGAKKK